MKTILTPLLSKIGRCYVCGDHLVPRFTALLTELAERDRAGEVRVLD